MKNMTYIKWVDTDGENYLNPENDNIVVIAIRDLFSNEEASGKIKNEAFPEYTMFILGDKDSKVITFADVIKKYIDFKLHLGDEISRMFIRAYIQHLVSQGWDRNRVLALLSDVPMDKESVELDFVEEENAYISTINTDKKSVFCGFFATEEESETFAEKVIRKLDELRHGIATRVNNLIWGVLRQLINETLFRVTIDGEEFVICPI